MYKPIMVDPIKIVKHFVNWELQENIQRKV